MKLHIHGVIAGDSNQQLKREISCSKAVAKQMHPIQRKEGQ